MQKMGIEKLIQDFYYGIPVSEYEAKAEEYQNVFSSNKTNKEQFLKSLYSFKPSNGFDHVKKYLKSEYDFKKVSKELEKAYNASGYSSVFSYMDCISAIFHDIAIVISFLERKPSFNREDYRRIKEYLKSDDFKTVFTEVYLKQTHAKSKGFQPEIDRCYCEAELFSHFAYRWFMGDMDYVRDYVDFVNKYTQIDEREENYPFLNEIERQIARKSKKDLNEELAKKYGETGEKNTKKVEKTDTVANNVAKNKYQFIEEEYLKTGKSRADLENIKSVCRTIFENNPVIQKNDMGELNDIDEYIIAVIKNETWYLSNNHSSIENMLDRYVNNIKTKAELASIRQVISEEDMKESFSLEGYGISFIKELALSLYRLFDPDPEELADLVKENELCKSAYNYLKNGSDRLILRIHHGAFEEYVSNLFGALLMNLNNRKISRMMYKYLKDAGIVFPDCYNSNFMNLSYTYKMIGQTPEAEQWVEEAAGIYLITYLKNPAATFGINEFINYFLNRYCMCIALLEEIPEDVNENTIKPIIDDFTEKHRIEREKLGRPEYGIKEAYSVYNAVTKTYGLNERFLWPENPLNAFHNDNTSNFMLDFTYYYFYKHIGKDKTIKTQKASDYFRAYSQALIYKSLIDCVLDDEQLIPPDFDLSFEQEYQELIDRSEKLEETIGEDRETLLEEINKLRENRDEWKNRAQSLHSERNELNKYIKKIQQESEAAFEESDGLREENEKLFKISCLYDELKAKQLEIDPKDIFNLLSSRKIAVSGGNKSTIQRLLDKYPNMEWYEKVSEISSSAGLMDYIFIMTQFNSHKLTMAIEKQVGNSKTKIITIGEVRSNFELVEKVIYNRIMQEEKV